MVGLGMFFKAKGTRIFSWTGVSEREESRMTECFLFVCLARVTRKWS